MTVIAYDGITLAADKLSNNGGTKATVKKIWRLKDGRLFGGAGDFGAVHSLKSHVESGSPLSASQSDKDDWAVGIVIGLDKSITIYERYGNKFQVEDKFYAVGSGRDYAIGAMAMGASSARAVEIASQHSTGCGMGVDVLQLSPLAPQKGPYPPMMPTPFRPFERIREPSMYDYYVKNKKPDGAPGTLPWWDHIKDRPLY